MLFLEHLICNIKQGADILAGCMVLRGHAPDVCIKEILNFGHCTCIKMCAPATQIVHTRCRVQGAPLISNNVV